MSPLDKLRTAMELWPILWTLLCAAASIGGLFISVKLLSKGQANLFRRVEKLEESTGNQGGDVQKIEAEIDGLRKQVDNYSTEARRVQESLSDQMDRLQRSLEDGIKTLGQRIDRLLERRD